LKVGDRVRTKKGVEEVAKHNTMKSLKVQNVHVVMYGVSRENHHQSITDQYDVCLIGSIHRRPRVLVLLVCNCFQPYDVDCLTRF
jgi:hypothetical protein